MVGFFIVGCQLVEETETGGNTSETVAVARVVDGDTLELNDGRTVRLIGINTPERGQPYYDEAREFLRSMVENQNIELEFDVEETDQYRRTLAYVWVDDTLINEAIIAEGYANSFTFPPNVKYQERFTTAERSAREAGRGLWQQGVRGIEIIAVNADAPGSDNENLNGEWVELRNTNNRSINLGGFTLKDEARNTLSFPSFTLGAGQTVRVYTGCGNNTRSAIYWCAGAAVWNNNGDSAYLRDAQGLFVSSFAY